MITRGLRHLARAYITCLGLALFVSVFGEDVARADTLEKAAGSLAKALVDQLLRHRDTHGQQLALQPLEPSRFKGLDERGRQQLHDLLVRSLGSEIRQSYRLVNPGRFKDISRMLEDSGDSAWFERYIELLRGAEADINISCSAGAPSKGAIELTCSADTVEPFVNRGAARTLLRTDWLAGPVDPVWGLASVAEAIVRHMQGAGNLNASVVDAQSGEETALSQSIAKRLLDEFHAKKRAWRGPRPVGGSQEARDYRARGEIERHETRFELRIELDSPEGVMETTFRETMNWTPDLRRLASGSGRQLPPQGGECGTDADIGKRTLADGMMLSDWILLAQEVRLKDGEYLNLIVEAKTLLSEHCGWDAVSDIMDAAVSGLAEELGTAIERDARSGLKRLKRVEASAGRHLALLRLRAQAHARLNGLREEKQAYTEWLAVAPADHPDRLAVLMAQRRIQARITIRDAEDALGLDGRRRSLVRRGLRVLGVATGEGNAEFDDTFRVLLRSWQTSNGHAETGYLTADQAGALVAEGRADEEREQDDAAFAQARAADTSKAYATYLARYPDGPHAPVAQRLLAAASAREAEERALKEAAAGEQLLGLRAEERVLIERGLASWKVGGSVVDGRFDDAFRTVLRDWQQEANGGRGTGYLTGEQAADLMTLGRKAEALKKDDTAFARAKAVDTAPAYEAYLSSYPNGRHAAAAKRSLEAIRAREDDAAFSRARAEGTEESYVSYLSAYPSGRHVVEAHRLQAEARRRAEAARTAEDEACPEIVSVYRKTMRDMSEYRYEYAFHDYLISRTKFENHWFVKWDDSKNEMILKNTFSDDIEQRVDWVGWPACYLGTERLSGSKVRIFYSGGSAGTSDVVDQFSFVEYDTDTRKFDNHVVVTISPSYGIGIDNCYANRESKSCRRAESWYEGSGLEEAELRVRAAREAAEARSKEEARSREEALGLTHAQRVLVQRGLAAPRGDDAGVADGLFDGDTREMIAVYQRAYGLTVTGYLTRELFEELMARGREAVRVERERREAEAKRQEEKRRAEAARRADDEAFGRAKAAGTVESYQSYLDEHPTGHHVMEARRLRAEVVARERSPLVGERFRDCESCPEMVVVPAGNFMMGSPSSEDERPGSEGPVHRVSIAKPFAVGVYEVTFAEWDACVKGGGCRGHRPDDKGWGRGRHPVIHVNWVDTQSYVQWLSRKTGKRYRLLSESEWEYVARAGTTGPFHYGETLSTSQANYDGRHTYGSGHKGEYRRRTVPVGSFPANAFGLHDVHGNVWERVDDCWNGSYAGAPVDGSARESGDCSQRVLRGGAWYGKPQTLRSARRSRGTNEGRGHGSGFRVVRNLTSYEAEKKRQEVEHQQDEAERRRADDAAFSKAKTEGTVEGYDSYLESNPLGRHVTEAQRLRAAAVVERKRSPVVGERFRDCAECPELVVVPAGDFMMGSLSWKAGREDSEGPVHRVTIGEPFAVGVYEVTRKEWSRFEEETSYSMEKGCWIIEGGKWAMNSGRHWRNPGFLQDDAHPVVCVSWEDAQAYVQWLSGKTGNRYRLLSESEWEYVTRAGTRSRYWWGDEVGRSRANCAGNPGCGSRWGGRQTASVGSFLSNAFGLYDVHGNVSEWVEDCLHENYTGAPADGSAWTAGGDCSYRITRGGSCFNPPMNIRSASRVGDSLKARSYNVGFRVAKMLE